jgi:hypothetical protein
MIGPDDAPFTPVFLSISIDNSREIKFERNRVWRRKTPTSMSLSATCTIAGVSVLMFRVWLQVEASQNLRESAILSLTGFMLGSSQRHTRTSSIGVSIHFCLQRSRPRDSDDSWLALEN